MQYPKFALTLDYCSIIDARTGLIAALLPYQRDPHYSRIADAFVALYYLEQWERMNWRTTPNGLLECSIHKRFLSVMEVACGNWIAFREGITLNNSDGSRVEFSKPYEAQYAAIDHAQAENFQTWRDPVTLVSNPYCWGKLTTPASSTTTSLQKSILIETDGKGRVFDYWVNFQATLAEQEIADALVRRAVSIFSKANKLARSKWLTYARKGMEPKLGAKYRSSKSYNPEDDLVRRIRDQILRGWADKYPTRLPYRFGIYLDFSDLEHQLARLPVN